MWVCVWVCGCVRACARVCVCVCLGGEEEEGGGISNLLYLASLSPGLTPTVVV